MVRPRPHHVKFGNVIWHPQFKIDRRPSKEYSIKPVVPALLKLSYEKKNMTDGRAFIIIPSAIRGHLIETYTCTVCTNPTVQLCFH